MYIKVGKTNIKYSSDVDDYMIFSEVPDSQLSYEKPILVRTEDELDIWFGRDFKSRDYFDELLKSGVTLYLYKPIQPNNTHDVDEYIDLSTYYTFPEIFLDLPSSGEFGYAYYLKTVDQEKHYYRFALNSGTNRYTWMPVDDIRNYDVLPQEYDSIYDLPTTGTNGKAYYVKNIPSYRYWYKWEDGGWIELEDSEELETYLPWRCLFADYDSLPLSNNYRYYTLNTKSWWKWTGSKWMETNDQSIQEFPIYFDTPGDLPEIGDNYKYFVDGTWCVWLANSWTPETLFPQNLDNLSGSLNNRDTLMISKPDDQEYYTPYSYPEFRLYEDNHLGVFSRDYGIDFSKSKVIDSDDITKGIKTLAIKLTYTSETLDEGYIIINSRTSGFNSKYGLELREGYNYCFWSILEPTQDLSAVYYNGKRIEISTIQDLLEAYRELGYKVIKTGDTEYLVYSSDTFDFTDFYTYGNIELINSFDDSENILTGYVQSNKGFEFYSKTIGTAYTDSENNIDSLISVDIEPASEYETYRVTIGRFNYTEIFEGPLFSDIGEERLDSIINNSSKLVCCDLSGLKNYIKPLMYEGKVGDLIETSDFIGIPNIFLPHYYVPPIGEPGVKYKVYEGLWKTWESSLGGYREITKLSYNFYDLTEEILNYPDFETLELEEGKSTRFKYYVSSTSVWYKWEDNEFTEVTEELLPTDSYSINVERLGYENYALHIIAGPWSETYRGDLFKLQSIINNSSRIFSEFSFKDLCNQLRTGKFYLRRGKNEKQTTGMYIKALGCLFDTQVDNVWPDFFLVPDIRKYTNDLTEIEAIEKDIFLEHAKNFNCQFLIQNNGPDYELVIVDSFEDIDDPHEGILYSNKAGTEYMIYENGELQEFTNRSEIEDTIVGGDFIFNYTNDISNYLVFFYKPLTILGHKRPAYYVFLDGLLRNVYSASETLINYDSPLESDPYELDSSWLVQNLEAYKSNYMINNNHIYYYKKYFNGDNYYSTVWMRFVLGKEYRELQKNKWSYLSEKSTGVIETALRNTLSRIQNTFSIIKFISLVRFRYNMSENYLEVTMETYISDLPENNITLDITVNYNETY